MDKFCNNVSEEIDLFSSKVPRCLTTKKTVASYLTMCQEKYFLQKFQDVRPQKHSYIDYTLSLLKSIQYYFNHSSSLFQFFGGGGNSIAIAQLQQLWTRLKMSLDTSMMPIDLTLYRSKRVYCSVKCN